MILFTSEVGKAYIPYKSIWPERPEASETSKARHRTGAKEIK
jgi:hypothetical protein